MLKINGQNICHATANVSILRLNTEKKKKRIKITGNIMLASTENITM
jgi:hypothetical protein